MSCELSYMRVQSHLRASCPGPVGRPGSFPPASMPTQPWLQKCSSWAAKAGLDKLKPTSSKLLQSVQPVENNGWADLPAEVIEAVLDNLNEKDCWSSRLISSNWGLVVRDYQCGLVVPVDPRTLWSHSSSFRQRQEQYPRTRFTFKLARPFDFGECAELLSATVNKDKLANCDLQLTLITKESISSAQVLQVCKDVKSIVVSSNSLQGQGVSVRIRLRAVLGYELAVLISKELGPFLHSIDYHQVLDLAAELTKASGFFSNPASFFSSAAFRNLSASSSPLQSLCLSDHSLPQCEACQGIALEHSISAIAELQHLTRLHLSIKARTDFEPLAQLSGLQDLALQSDSRSASACGVLTSSRQTLERVILTSRGWDTATLSALDTLPKLRAVTIKVLSLAVEDAVVLSRLLQPDSIQIMLRKCSKMVSEAFIILSSSQANITHLELWEMENACLCKLQSMQSLIGLTIVRPSSDFTGEALVSQPNLDTLRLVSCFALTDDGLRSLLAAAPLIKMLLIQQELQHTCPAELSDSDVLTKHGLVSVAQASNLAYLDLQGVKITRGGEKLLESTICAQQKAGKMPAAVAMVLPKFSKRYGDNVFTPECLHYPAFAPIPDGRRNLITCGNANKNQELKDTIVAVQGLQLSRR